ncbi:hypothetical protein LRK24_06330 [Rhodanobacter denitrificans]|uniref:hypothetical protein n=1 Tax=Rhodanobacter denitrificans TaxID=666685 RepID=UPI000260D924|nr:hypothetical protein [Rhodanobacter denitrificans]EIM04486.1 hypothetical protein UUC_01212 [Rhodanobacter denitrificans]UJM91532.1 hypothetical protein LRK24_06330 [Rhodanobacter denitrificans]
MKALVVSAVLLLAPLAAQAACAPGDFAIKDFKPGVAASRLSLRGELVNNCAAASAAQVRIEVKDAGGKVLQSKQGWPAGTANIPPGDVVKFDLGRLFRYQPDIDSYTVSVVDVRTW